MNELGIKGLPKRRMPRSARLGGVGGPDLVRREFRREAPDELWMTDIERHEALSNRAVMKGHRLRLVAAGSVKLRAA